jgi:hypothetical protein
MMRSRRRHALAALTATVAATASFAFAAQNTVPDSNAGLGEGEISGYTVANLSWDLDNADPGVVDDFTFTISPTTAAEVRVALDQGSGFTWLAVGDCANASGTVICTPTSTVDTEDLVGIRVAAAS